MMLGGTHIQHMHAKGTRAHLVIGIMTIDMVFRVWFFLSTNEGGEGKGCCSLEFETAKRCIVTCGCNGKQLNVGMGVGIATERERREGWERDRRNVLMSRRLAR